MSEKIAVIGLGYVGLPVAIALAEKFAGVVGFDISRRRVDALREGRDWTGEIEDEVLAASSLHLTDDPADLAGATFLIVTVPTPIDAENRPNLGPVESACRFIGPNLRRGAIVVFESTVYPGVTDEVCAPLLEQTSGLKRGTDFELGYSPERINPGDKVHRLQTITKIVSAGSPEALDRVTAVYGAIVDAGLHVAPSIKVAEAAKVIENTQRDLNVALMNEFALIFDRMNIRTADVLAAAGTKWNFLPFTPGLVGGHCIGVDPYYLTSAAERYGYHPEVILAGRRINDSMGAYVAQKLIKLLVRNGVSVAAARVGVLGLTFKENVPDLRNSKVPDILEELREFNIAPMVADPHADPDEARHEFGVELASVDAFGALDAVILAVNHAAFAPQISRLGNLLTEGGIVIDIKAALDPSTLPSNLTYWSL